MVYDFGDFELDTRLCELRREAERHHLEPQVYDVLEYLVTHRDRLVTRDELLDQVWGHRFVTPSALSTRIKTARRAVGDDGRAQRIIRTVRGRGFRFLAEVEARPGSEAAGPPAHGSEPLAVPSPSEDASASPTPRARALVRKPSRPPPLVGRGAELEALGGRWSEATGGRRGIVLVAGESGIGKTAIAEAFAWSVRDEGGRVARGQCLEQRGAGEPYLPFLDALSRLCRAPGGSEVSRLLSTHAPTWLAQIPSVSVPSDVEATAVAGPGSTKARMLREMGEALEALSVRAPLLVVLEDLHWSDPSTLELLRWLGTRPDPARLLVLGTYRPAEAEPALADTVRALRRSKKLTEIRPGYWSASEIERVLETRFPKADFPEELPELILERTTGNPLFVGSLLDDWVDTGELEEGDGGWRIPTDVEALRDRVPRSLHDALERRVGRMSEGDRMILEGASVVGATFSCARRPVPGVAGPRPERPGALRGSRRGSRPTHVDGSSPLRLQPLLGGLVAVIPGPARPGARAGRPGRGDRPGLGTPAQRGLSPRPAWPGSISSVASPRPPPGTRGLRSPSPSGTASPTRSRWPSRSSVGPRRWADARTRGSPGSAEGWTSRGSSPRSWIDPTVSGSSRRRSWSPRSGRRRA